MPDVTRLMPGPAEVEPAALVAALRTAQRQLVPFSAPVTEFCSDVARRLRRHPEVRAYPAVGALAWWIRPASVEELRRHWERYVCADPETVRAPRGVVFHIPPTNVDTMFVYSWLLSALVGNANVIRLSPTAAQASPLLQTLAAALAEHPLVAQTTAVITYGHDKDVTAALSNSDMRVIWGGDATVAAIRAVSLASHASELTFPDRYSFAVIDAPAIAQLDEGQVDGLVAAFVNDAYWFDQLGCASPRLIVWRGGVEATVIASRRFHAALVERLNGRDGSIATSAVIAKLVHAGATAADGHATRIDWTSNDATFVDLSDLTALPRDSPGGGLFYQVRLDSLEQLLPHVDRRDQTVTTFGLAHAELEAFAHQLGARGVERIVPAGQALTFNHRWDGRDLLVEFSRSIHVPRGSS